MSTESLDVELSRAEFDGDGRSDQTARQTARGEFQEQSKITLHEYAREWVERYQGTGRRRFREEAPNEYGTASRELWK